MSDASDAAFNKQMAASFNQAGLTSSTMSQINNTIIDKSSCDSDCQKERREKLLKSALTQAKADAVRAENKYNDFISANEDQSMMNDRRKQTIDELRRKSMDKFSKESKEMDVLVGNYDLVLKYRKQMEALLLIKKKENKRLKDANEKTVGVVHTNDRKVEYELSEMKPLKRYRIILLVIYYICAIFIYVSGLYKTRKGKIYAVLYLIFPFLIGKYVLLVYNIVNKWNNLFRYKNVYYNL